MRYPGCAVTVMMMVMMGMGVMPVTDGPVTL